MRKVQKVEERQIKKMRLDEWCRLTAAEDSGDLKPPIIP